MALNEKNIEIAKKKFTKDLLAFGRFFFPHLLTKEPGRFHQEICDILVSDKKYIALEVFRGSGKSTLGLIIKPIHDALLIQRGNILLISKSEEFVLNQIARVIKKEFESNDTLKYFFGDQTTTKWSETFFALKNGIAFESRGISGQLRGGRNGLICLDDLEDEETASSQEQRDKLRARVNKEIIPKMLADAQLVYMGTPVTQLCYIHSVVQAAPDNGWYAKVFPAYQTKEQKEGNEQWSAVFPHSRLQELKATIGSSYFATEYLCTPVSEELAPIKDHMINYWKDMPQQYSCVIATDPSYKEDEKADYKTTVVVGIDDKGNRYLFDYVRTHAPMGEWIDQSLNMYMRWKNKLTAFGVPAGREVDVFRSFEQRARDRHLAVPFVEIRNSFTSLDGKKLRGKIARVKAALAPIFERGQYYIHKTHVEARQELLEMSEVMEHDDIIDALQAAENILTPGVYFEGEKLYNDTRDKYSIIESRGSTGYGW